ncbi:MAG: LPS export ABC transporter periplasmic protein LptC [Spirulina sp. SIO3F2]|nr:LPS export ABC transporter periplasmic protein LptC [Spirulina sp. SIO3F2]
MRRKVYRRRIKPKLLWGLALVLIASFGVACRTGSPASDVDETASESATYEEQLILNNATLENADEAGQVLWKIKAQRTRYEPNKKGAQIEGITGNLYQEGQIVLKFKADEGEIIGDGQELFLRKNVVGLDPRTGVVLQCQEVQWLPEDGVLMARESLHGSNDAVHVRAKQGKYWTKTRILEAQEDVVIDGQQNPMQARTDKVVWDLPKARITSDRPIEFDRYQSDESAATEDAESEPTNLVSVAVTGVALLPNSALARQQRTENSTDERSKPEASQPVITDRVVAQSAEFDLKKQVVLLKKEVESRSVDPPLQIASDSIIWNLANRTVLSDTPVQVVNREDAVTLTANEGFINLDTEVLRLTGGARGINTRKPADLYANQIVWYLQRERIEAAGNVIYRQVDPPLDLAGSRAIGRLKDQTITVTGGEGGGRVLTKIVP